MDNVQLIKEAAKKSATAKKTKIKAPTLHEKVDKLTESMSKANKPAPKKAIFQPKKLGLIAAGAAGASALVHKVRQHIIGSQ